MSADGAVVGQVHSENGFEAFRWTAATGMVGLGDLPGGPFASVARGVSGDGSVVVGRSLSANGTEAFRCTQATGMVGFGDLPGSVFLELSGPSMAAAINPTGDLVFTDIEGAVVVQHFARMSRSLISFDKSNAEPEVVVAALKGRSYWHFASHGNFDWNDVRASGLLMRHKEVLSIGRLLDAEGSLGHPRLVVLSACETGLYDITRNPEEFLGLPATFLQIGAAGVVSSLWPVDDLATALLVAKFYDLHMQEQLSPPKSLKAAQTWVRDATRSELLTYARDAAARAKLHPAQLAAFESNLTETRRTMRLRVGAALRADGGVVVALPAIQDAANQPFMESRPFKHPYYWGGFIYTGL